MLNIFICHEKFTKKGTWNVYMIWLLLKRKLHRLSLRKLYWLGVSDCEVKLRVVLLLVFHFVFLIAHWIHSLWGKLTLKGKKQTLFFQCKAQIHVQKKQMSTYACVLLALSLIFLSVAGIKSRAVACYISIFHWDASPVPISPYNKLHETRVWST